MLLNYGVGGDSWESLGLQGDSTIPSQRRSVLGIHWKDWCWNWNSSTLATWWEELTHLKRPWCWERLKAGGEGDDRGWDGWMASLTQWTWVWVNSGSWWWTGRPGMLQSMGLQRVGHDWATELTELKCYWWRFPGGASGKGSAWQCRRHRKRGLNPWVRKIPWRRKWPPTPVFLPEESHGQRSLTGYIHRFARWTWLKWHMLLMGNCSFFYLQTLLTSNVCFSPHQPILQVTQYQVGVLQFSYDTNCPELAQTSRVKGPLSYGPFFQLQMPVINPRF